MGTITSSVGLISGINTGSIIDQLIALDSQPKTLLQTRIASNTAQKQAYTDLETPLQSLQTVGKALELPATFLASTATSSDPSVLTATTTAGAPQGSYQFQVAQLVSAQQTISSGYPSTSALMQAGTISLEIGGGNLNPQTTLAELNGGTGVSRGQFRITDGSGKSDVIDISSAITLDDVVSKINTSLDINVQASVQGDHLVLNDNSSGGSPLSIQDMGGGTSAKDLGIATTTGGSTFAGSSIDYLGSGTALSSLNDGRGIRTASAGSNDLSITASDGSTFNVKLGQAQTVGDVINAINTAAGGKVKASLRNGSQGITLADQTGGGGSLSVANASGSNAAQDLGILKTNSGGVINGDPIVAGIDTVLLSSLKGGAGIPAGSITIQDRNNQSATINLSGAKTLQNILDTINNTGGIGVHASLNASGDGIQIADTSGGTGNLVIADANGGTTAASLGIAGTFDSTKPIDDGGDLHLQYVTQNTLLSNYNGGKGVTAGSFKITNAAGGNAIIDLRQGTFTTLGDVMKAINSSNIGVTAAINANGNGILLTDNSGGAGHMAVTNVAGTTASDLNLASTTTANTIDGAMQKTITVTATDTLATVQAKIQASGFGVAASIINDGSAQSPYRLSITATNSGRAGRVIIDPGSTGLQFRNLVEAQDAAVFVGGSGSAQPLLVTSSSNQITNIIPGVTLALQSASATPVSLSVTRDGSGISKQLQTFSDSFNSLVDKLNTYTKYDTTTNQAGLLLGDSTAQTIQQQLYTVFNSSVSSAGIYRTLGDIGMTLTDGAKIQFDANKFASAFAADPDAVKHLFTQASTGLGTVIDQSMTSLVDPISGAITQESQTLDAQNTSFQTQIDLLDQILADKRTRLEEQFANMESVLANLQGQQAALNTLSTLTTSKSSGGTSSPAPSSSGSTSSDPSSTGSTSSSGSSSTGSSTTSSTTG